MLAAKAALDAVMDEDWYAMSKTADRLHLGADNRPAPATAAKVYADPLVDLVKRGSWSVDGGGGTATVFESAYVRRGRGQDPIRTVVAAFHAFYDLVRARLPPANAGRFGLAVVADGIATPLKDKLAALGRQAGTGPAAQRARAREALAAERGKSVDRKIFARWLFWLERRAMQMLHNHVAARYSRGADYLALGAKGDCLVYRAMSRRFFEGVAHTFSTSEHLPPCYQVEVEHGIEFDDTVTPKEAKAQRERMVVEDIPAALTALSMAAGHPRYVREFDNINGRHQVVWYERVADEDGRPIPGLFDKKISPRNGRKRASVMLTTEVFVNKLIAEVGIDHPDIEKAWNGKFAGDDIVRNLRPADTNRVMRWLTDRDVVGFPMIDPGGWSLGTIRPFRNGFLLLRELERVCQRYVRAADRVDIPALERWLNGHRDQWFWEYERGCCPDPGQGDGGTVLSNDLSMLHCTMPEEISIDLRRPGDGWLAKCAFLPVHDLRTAPPGPGTLGRQVRLDITKASIGADQLEHLQQHAAILGALVCPFNQGYHNKIVVLWNESRAGKSTIIEGLKQMQPLGAKQGSASIKRDANDTSQFKYGPLADRNKSLGVILDGEKPISMMPGILDACEGNGSAEQKYKEAVEIGGHDCRQVTADGENYNKSIAMIHATNSAKAMVGPDGGWGPRQWSTRFLPIEYVRRPPVEDKSLMDMAKGVNAAGLEPYYGAVNSFVTILVYHYLRAAAGGRSLAGPPGRPSFYDVQLAKARDACPVGPIDWATHNLRPDPLPQRGYEHLFDGNVYVREAGRLRIATDGDLVAPTRDATFYDEAGDRLEPLAITEVREAPGLLQNSIDLGLVVAASMLDEAQVTRGIAERCTPDFTIHRAAICPHADPATFAVHAYHAFCCGGPRTGPVQRAVITGVKYVPRL